MGIMGRKQWDPVQEQLDFQLTSPNMTSLLADDGNLPPTVDPQSCQLLGTTALIVQGLMGLLVVLSLVFKRHRETPKRPWRIWLFDVSKQLVGQALVHFLNVLISDLVSHYASNNACVSYFLNVLIDTTLGVGIIYVVLNSITRLFSDKFHVKGMISGQYGTPPSFSFWARQAAVYVVSLCTMKITVLGLLALFPGLFKIGEWILSWTDGNNGTQVIFVMGVVPIVMNVIQFWLIDTIVKSGEEQHPIESALSSSRDSQDREPLFRASDEFHDDDDGPERAQNASQRPKDLEAQNNTVKPPSVADDTKSNQSGPSNPSASGPITPPRTDAPIASHSYPPFSSEVATAAKRPDHTVRSRPSTLSSPAHPESRMSRSAAPSQDWDDSWHDDDWADSHIARRHQVSLKEPWTSAATISVSG